MDGPWGSSSGNNKPGSGGGFSGGGNNDSIDDLLKDLKNKYKFKGSYAWILYLTRIFSWRY